MLYKKDSNLLQGYNQMQNLKHWLGTPKTTFPSLLAAATILICAFALKNFELPVIAKIFIALFPAIPTVVLLFMMGKEIMGMDELQRKIQVEGLALAFGGTCFVTLVYGMLQIANLGLPNISSLYVYVLMVLLYAIGTFISGLRYR